MKTEYKDRKIYFVLFFSAIVMVVLGVIAGFSLTYWANSNNKWDRSERREILRSKISLTSLMGHMPAGAFGAGWLARCLRQSEFDVSQILTVLGGGCP